MWQSQPVQAIFPFAERFFGQREGPMAFRLKRACVAAGARFEVVVLRADGLRRFGELGHATSFHSVLGAFRFPLASGCWTFTLARILMSRAFPDLRSSAMNCSANWGGVEQGAELSYSGACHYLLDAALDSL